jgi:hypothetical protein
MRVEALRCGGESPDERCGESRNVEEVERT